MDPDEVTSPVLDRLDRYIDQQCDLRDFLKDLRCLEYTKAYDRQRKARINSLAPTRNPRDAA
jgi:hypothetical protein